MSPDRHRISAEAYADFLEATGWFKRNKAATREQIVARQIAGQIAGEARGREFEAALQAEHDRRATLSPRERELEDARTALMLAEHNDTNGGHKLVAQCRAQLAALHVSA